VDYTENCYPTMCTTIRSYSVQASTRNKEGTHNFSKVPQSKFCRSPGCAPVAEKFSPPLPGVHLLYWGCTYIFSLYIMPKKFFTALGVQAHHHLDTLIWFAIDQSLCLPSYT